MLLVDSNLRVIAASDGQGLLSERIPLALERPAAAASITTVPAALGRLPRHARLRDLSRVSAGTA